MNKINSFRLVVGLLLIGVALAYAVEKAKLTVSLEYEQEGDRIYLIRDIETGAHCVAITNDVPGGNGYAISCLPQPSH